MFFIDQWRPDEPVYNKHTYTNTHFIIQVGIFQARVLLHFTSRHCAALIFLCMLGIFTPVPNPKIVFDSASGIFKTRAMVFYACEHSLAVWVNTKLRACLLNINVQVSHPIFVGLCADTRSDNSCWYRKSNHTGTHKYTHLQTYTYTHIHTHKNTLVCVALLPHFCSFKENSVKQISGEPPPRQDANLSL